MKHETKIVRGNKPPKPAAKNTRKNSDESQASNVDKIIREEAEKISSVLEKLAKN